MVSDSSTTLLAPAKMAATVSSHERVAADAGILRLRTEPAPPTFAPGQFMQLRPSRYCEGAAVASPVSSCTMLGCPDCEWQL